MLTVARRPFGKLPDGSAIDVITMAAGSGVEVSAITYGGIITSIRTPDRRGRAADVVLGYDALEPYLHNRSYFGGLIGRYANRIARGRFDLDGHTFRLAINDGANHLHGGPAGFHTRVWHGQLIEESGRVGVTFTRVSEDGEEGYPGQLRVRVSYSLTDAGDIVLDYEAETDAPTIVSLTQHTYFNLSGAGDTLDHELTLDADAYTPVGDGLIPTGEIAPVRGTPFDFRAPTRIGARCRAAHAQLRLGRGYDHNWVLRRDTPALVRAVRVDEPHSGRRLELFTTEPGLQFYGGQLLEGATGRDRRPLTPYAGFCLETQQFPDAPNHRQFPSPVLRPGSTFRSTTVWRLGVSA